MSLATLESISCFIFHKHLSFKTFLMANSQATKPLDDFGFPYGMHRKTGFYSEKKDKKKLSMWPGPKAYKEENGFKNHSRSLSLPMWLDIWLCHPILSDSIIGPSKRRRVFKTNTFRICFYLCTVSMRDDSKFYISWLYKTICKYIQITSTLIWMQKEFWFSCELIFFLIQDNIVQNSSQCVPIN